MDSFDHYATADAKTAGQKLWLENNVGFPYIISAGNGRNGTNCLRCDGWGRSGGSKSISGSPATIIVGFGFRFNALPPTDSPILTISNSSTNQVTIGLDSSGVLEAFRGTVTGTLLGASAIPLSINTYYYIECKVTIDNAAGVVNVRVDNATHINLTAQDTDNGGGAAVDQISIGGGGAGSAANIDFDDLYVCDTSGSANNDFLGDCRVVVLVPDGAGSSSQWTPSAGSNFQCVDDNPPDGDGTRVSANAVNDIDTYTFGAVGLALTPRGVAVWNHAREGLFGFDSVIRAISRPGATNYFGANSDNIQAAIGYGFRGNVFETNGDTGLPWTISEIDGAQFGFQFVSGSPTNTFVTQSVVEVLLSAIPVGNRITQYVVEAITQPSAAAGFPLIRMTQYVLEAILSASTEVTPGTPCAPTSSIQQTYPPCYGAEFDNYIAPDGHTYDFHVKGLRHLMTEEGFGMPPITYLTTAGPVQHGETVHDWFLNPRIIQLMISNSSNSRQEYTRARAALLDAIRPNRQTMDHHRELGVLRKRLSDGSLRDLKVMIESGPGFGPRDLTRWDEYRFQEILRFIAHDPILFNPLQQCRSFLAVAGSPGSGGGSQLIFPATFPILFGIGTGSGGGGGGLSGVLQYNGTWEEYPQIVIHGPVTGIVIENQSTGERLAIEDEILEGETVTFDLTYAIKTVTHSDGSNWLGMLSDDSDLATFHLTTINNGANVIIISGSGTNAAMFVEFFYYERFIGR